MSEECVPDSVNHPLSLKADYANPFPYGGASVIVGFVGLIGAAVAFVQGNSTAGGYLLVSGALLIAAGYLVARRGK